jgi:hypothetical protein
MLPGCAPSTMRTTTSRSSNANVKWRPIGSSFGQYSAEDNRDHQFAAVVSESFVKRSSSP